MARDGVRRPGAGLWARPGPARGGPGGRGEGAGERTGGSRRTDPGRGRLSGPADTGRGVADAITFTCGRAYRLEPDPVLRAAVLSRPPGPEADAVRAAAGRGRLVPPTVARTAGAGYLLPPDAVLFGADGRAFAGTRPAAADFLRVLAGLLDDLRAELPGGPLALAADPAAVGFVPAPAAGWPSCRARSCRRRPIRPGRPPPPDSSAGSPTRRRSRPARRRGRGSSSGWPRSPTAGGRARRAPARGRLPAAGRGGERGRRGRQHLRRRRPRDPDRRPTPTRQE